ncbi:hypothetical protein J6590_005994 [Homalodisca vitripennis]|nr:hypothetical protein J6590_005994 [Homalodisca vitripennis]
MPYIQQQEGTDNNKPEDSSQLAVSQSYTKRLPPLLCLCLTDSNRKGLTTTNHMTVPSWLRQHEGTDNNIPQYSSQLAVTQSYTKRLPPLLCLCLTYSNRKGLTTTNHMTVPSWLQQQEETDDNKSHDSSQLAVSQSYTKRLLPQLCLCLTDGNMKGLTTTNHKNSFPAGCQPILRETFTTATLSMPYRQQQEGTDDNKSHDSSQWLSATLLGNVYYRNFVYALQTATGRD